MVIIAFICLIVAYFMGKQYSKFNSMEFNYRVNGKKASGMIVDNEDTDKKGVRIKINFFDLNGKEQSILSNPLKDSIQAYPIGKKLNITYLLDGEEINMIVDNEEKNEYKKKSYLGLCIAFAVLTFVCFVVGAK